MRQLFGNPVIEFKDNLYIVNRIIRAEDSPDVDLWKGKTISDIALKHNGLYYFCSIVQDAEILEDEKFATKFDPEVLVV